MTGGTASSGSIRSSEMLAQAVDEESAKQKILQRIRHEGDNAFALSFAREMTGGNDFAAAPLVTLDAAIAMKVIER